MALRPPLAEWSFVTRTVNEGGPSHEFSVLKDGTVLEFVGGSEPFEYHLTVLELKVLDALVDQINREPIPQEPKTFRPDGDSQDRLLFIGDVADPFGVPDLLFADLPEGTIYAADDKLDIVEIAALNAYMAYLDRKYSPDLDV
jgi:hypothetical protein